jgi:signal transduction histidine kinase
MPSTGPEAEFLSTLPASRGAHRLAYAVLAISVVFFIMAAPFAKMPLAQISAFLPAYQAALVISEFLTALLLFGQFNILRYRALLVLACAYLLSAVMAAAHLLSFPGLLSPGGMLGAGPQTTAWLYFMWHATFPLLVIVYALMKEKRTEPTEDPVKDMTKGIAAVVAGAAGMVMLGTAGHDALPTIMAGNTDAPAKFAVAFATWCLCLAALWMLWRRGTRTVLDLWLVVVMCVWIFDIALAGVLNGGRFDLGWYMGRVYGLMGGTFVLAVLVLENSMLYARLTVAHRRMGELNKELESFSYSVSHDLRSPLRAVNGYARILEEGYADRLDAEGLRLLGVINTQAERMGQLINDLLDFSRLGRQAISKAEVDTNSLVEEVIAGLQAEAGEKPLNIARSPLPATMGDRALLRQVWANLIGNAVKYSSKRAQPSVEVGCTRKDGAEVFYVKDNGAGFDMKYYEKLFGVFQRVHSDKEFPGTGIGLAIVQKIVTRHGGQVWAHGEVNAGATFFFSIPKSESDFSFRRAPQVPVLEIQPAPAR